MFLAIEIALVFKISIEFYLSLEVLLRLLDMSK
jgi:hypothetical protein